MPIATHETCMGEGKGGGGGGGWHESASQPNRDVRACLHLRQGAEGKANDQLNVYVDLLAQHQKLALTREGCFLPFAIATLPGS